MAMLIHDRYLAVGPDRARDLATGGEVPLAGLAPAAAVRVMPALEGLFDALDHARDGGPQRRTLWVRDRLERRTLLDALADGAQRRGFVPVHVSLYRQARAVLAEDLRDRAIVLIDPDDVGEEAEFSLLTAVAVSPRPHTLVTLREPRRAMDVVREAHAVFGVAAARSMPGVHPEVSRLVERGLRAGRFVASGRHASAERLLRETAAALERRGAFAQAGRTTTQLGWLFFERGRMVEADACGGAAASLADRAREPRLGCEARLLQASARFERVQVAEAESLARGVLLCAPDPGLSSCAQATLARCLIEQQRHRELQDLDLSLRVKDGVDVRWQALVHDAAVSVLIESGRLFDAGHRIRTVLDEWSDDEDGLATAIVRTAHLRVVAATGDLTLARRTLDGALDAARRARASFRALRARVIWYAALARAGAGDVVGDERARHRRLLGVAPPMLVREIEAAGRSAPERQRLTPPRSQASLTATMIALSQEDDDLDAVKSILSVVRDELDASRIDVISVAGGPATSVATAGTGPAAALGVRVVESGLCLGFEDADDGGESGVPVRVGPRLLAALVARWPRGRALPADRRDVLECAAVVMAARVESLQQRARESAVAAVQIPELFGSSSATSELRKAVMRAARAPFSVLIEGESGVGKELVARAIHQMSARRERRFCDINCAALPDELFETELFGHAKGAFTGAVSERAGLFEEASGGTLFLDEVADLTIRAQAKLLRAVQQQEIRRVGESFARGVDVRFVAAANRQMAGEVEAGRFRADLLYRLDVIHIRIAPLRERPEDIPVIAERLWRQAAERVGSRAELAPAAMAALVHYAWPGNVRELQNVIAALAVAAPPRGRVRASLLPAVISASAGVSAGHLAPARDQFERRFLELALARAAGNRTRAARSVGLSRQGLLKSMARLGLVGPTS